MSQVAQCCTRALISRCLRHVARGASRAELDCCPSARSAGRAGHCRASLGAEDCSEADFVPLNLSFSTALLDSVRVQTDAKDKTLYALRDVASVGVREGALLVTCFEAEVRLFSILRRRLAWRR